MKLEEKIELLTAYAKDKKLVEVYDENTDSWMIKVFDVWDFEGGKYRIKSKIESKFKAGDVLVRRSDEGKPIKDNENYLFTIEEADQDAGLYYLSNEQAVDMKTAHSDYLDAFGSKVLWYWEIKTDGDWSMPTSTRKTFQEAIELTSNDNKPVS